MKGKDLKKKVNVLEINNTKYELALDMNALCELEEIYGDIKEAINILKIKPMKTVRDFLYAMLKSSDPEITILKAGKLIDTKNFNKVIDIVTNIIEEAFPEEEKEEVKKKRKVKKA